MDYLAREAAKLAIRAVRKLLSPEHGEILPAIDQMTGRQFEECLFALFEAKHCRPELTRHTGDFGADLIITREGKRTAVQAKRQRNAVGLQAVQEVVASLPVYRCARAMIITNASYTAAAQKLADLHRVELWDRDRLARELRGFPQSELARYQPPQQGRRRRYR